MISFFNLIGLGFVIAGIALAVGLSWVHPPDDGVGYVLFVFGAVFVIDLSYRYHVVRPRVDRDSGEKWLTTDRGGSLMLMPAWLFSVVGPLAIWWLFNWTENYDPETDWRQTPPVSSRGP